MDERTAFKVAWLQHFANLGYSMAETHAATKVAIAELREKQADGGVLGALGAVGKAGLGFAQAAGLTGLVAPPLAGAAVGFAAGRAGGVDQVDVDEMKKQEIIDEYRRLAERARRLSSMKAYRPSTTRAL